MSKSDSVRKVENESARANDSLSAYGFFLLLPHTYLSAYLIIYSAASRLVFLVFPEVTALYLSVFP